MTWKRWILAAGVTAAGVVGGAGAVTATSLYDVPLTGEAPVTASEPDDDGPDDDADEPDDDADDVNDNDGPNDPDDDPGEASGQED